MFKIVATALAVLLTSVVTGLPPDPAVAESGTSASKSAGKLPSKKQWEADVRAVMRESVSYLRERVAQARADGVDVATLAINLDIDNSSLASHYAPGKAIGPTLRLAREANELGVRVFINTARPPKKRKYTERELARAGYDVDRVCMRPEGYDAPSGKQRCRAYFVFRGYTLIANVGNRPTDFEGGDYERSGAFRLPNYGGRLD